MSSKSSTSLSSSSDKDSSWESSLSISKHASPSELLGYLCWLPTWLWGLVGWGCWGPRSIYNPSSSTPTCSLDGFGLARYSGSAHSVWVALLGSALLGQWTGGVNGASTELAGGAKIPIRNMRLTSWPSIGNSQEAALGSLIFSKHFTHILVWPYFNIELTVVAEIKQSSYITKIGRILVNNITNQISEVSQFSIHNFVQRKPLSTRIGSNNLDF